MTVEDFVSDLVGGGAKPSRWAVTTFVASCTFAAGAMALLILSWV